MNELQASLVLRAGAELLKAASADPRSEEGYSSVRANVSEALNAVADALENFEAGAPEPNRSKGWAQDLRRVADDVRER